MTTGTGSSDDLGTRRFTDDRPDRGCESGVPEQTYRNRVATGLASRGRNRCLVFIGLPFDNTVTLSGLGPPACRPTPECEPVARKGRRRRFDEARAFKRGFDDGLFAEGDGTLADVDHDDADHKVDRDQVREPQEFRPDGVLDDRHPTDRVPNGSGDA